MKQIEILKKAISKKHPCNECHEALQELEKLLNDAPAFFATCDFDGDKLEWLKRSGFIED